MKRIISPLRRFFRKDDGAAILEFAITLPLVLVVFAIIVEGTRTFMSYQATISGVRDAARYLARVTPVDICPGGSVAAWDDEVTAIVQFSSSGQQVFPNRVTVTDVTPSYRCVSGTFRISPQQVAIAQVTADVTIDFPLGAVFSFVGATLPQLTTRVADESRVYGL